MSGQQTKRVAAVFATFVLIGSFFVAATVFLVGPHLPSNPMSPDIYVGVDAAFGTVEDTKGIIDQVKGYTNFFVVGSTAITNDIANITQVCQYLNSSGLQFLTYAHPAAGLNFSQVQWVSDARQSYPGFVGLFGYDEPGGNQMDHVDQFMCAHEASSYVEAAQSYVGNLTYYLSGIKVGWEIGNFPIFTSDYALYEYDYRAGYSVVLATFAWNLSRPLNVALCRGAATLHGESWGVIITGNATAGDMETGPQLYDDMVYAYENGAKYILVFDYPKLAGGILRQEHFDAMRQFWQYAQAHPRQNSSANQRSAYVLPKDYGYGFRSDVDKIWGLWEADNMSSTVWNQANSLQQQYSHSLDIVYEDSPSLSEMAYNQYIYWNGAPPA